MEIDTRTEILKTCIDILADFPHLTTTPDKEYLLHSIIDTLGGYPKPHQKHSETEPTPTALGAYLFASTTRNIAKLGCIGFYSYTEAVRMVSEILERAFSLLVDKQAE